MVKVLTQEIVIKINKLGRDSDTDTNLIDNEAVAEIQQIIEELLKDKNLIIEVE